MMTRSNMTDLSSAPSEAGCDAFVRGRLGHELGLIYHDTLQAPLPAGLQRLLDRLEQKLRATGDVPLDRVARR